MENGNLSNVTMVYRCIPMFSGLLIATTAVFTVIFLLSVIGNSLVIVTIVQNRRMRTPTNMFLLSLALSDLLLSVICMPPTLTGLLFRCYFYGSFMCRLTTYLQPLSVAASSHTLVVIAVERYYAICKPLQSRKWQTKRHCVKMIGTVWILSMILNLPYVIFAQIRPAGPGRNEPNCAPTFPYHDDFKRYYWLFLGIVLFVIPSIVMTFLYFAVIRTLYIGIADDSAAVSIQRTSGTDDTLDASGAEPSASASQRSTSTVKRVNLRSTHSHRNLLAKKKVIRMLAVIVIEFNTCWTPLFFYHTLINFDVMKHTSLKIFVPFLSLAYLSACCNPLTYCFMNKKFRNAFLMAFGCSTKSSLTNTSIYHSTYQHARFLALQHRNSTSADKRLIDTQCTRKQPMSARNDATANRVKLPNIDCDDEDS